MSDTIEREVHIDAPVERVWELITSAEHVGRWFGDAGAELELRPGGALKVHWKDNGSVDGVVEDVEPTTRFSYRWRHPDAASTLVEFTLTPTGSGTRLHVRESGFATRRSLYDGHLKGWEIELGHLADHARARV